MSQERAGPIISKYHNNGGGDGTTFFGSKGWITLSRGDWEQS